MCHNGFSSKTLIMHQKILNIKCLPHNLKLLYPHEIENTVKLVNQNTNTCIIHTLS